MRILFLSNLYPPNVVGGYERLCHEMATALAERGHAVCVLTSDYGDAREDYPGQEIRREWRLPTGMGDIYAPFAGSAGERAAIDRANIARLETAVSDWQPEVVFVWNLYFLDAGLLDAIRRLRRPTVYLLTDNWLIAFLQPAFLQDYFAREVFAPPRTPPGWLKRLAKRWRARRAMRSRQLPGQAIFASRFMADLYAEAGLFFDGNRIVHHGIAAGASVEPPPRNRLRQPGRLRLLFAGRVVEIKGVHTAIEALPKIRSALPELSVSLTILGDRRDRAYQGRLETLIAGLNVAEAVEFVDSVEEDALPEVFASHDLYLFPSLYEPFSLTLIHALRSGIPTVASDAGGNGEIVFDRRSGLLFRQGDSTGLATAAIALARDDALRASVAREGRRIAQGFTFERMVDEVERCLGDAR